jgi:hypothetical protein
MVARAVAKSSSNFRFIIVDPPLFSALLCFKAAEVA